MNTINDSANNINVAVIDDDANIRNGLWWLLNNIAGIHCIGTYSGCKEFLLQKDLTLDVLLLDVTMPGMSGLEGIRPIKTRYPGLKIIMHSNFDDEDKIMRAQRSGAAGYVLKNASAPQLHEAILTAARGDTVWPVGFERNVMSAKPPSFFQALTEKVRMLRH